MAFHEEAVAVVRNAQLFRQLGRTLAGFDAHGEHHQIGLDFHGLAQQGIHAHDRHLAVAVRVNLRHAATDVFRAVFFHGPAGKLVVHLPWSADVHVEDKGLGIGNVILGQDGLLGRVHAAEAGAVGTAHGFVARANALHKDDVLGFLAVRGALHMPARGAGCGEQALVLQGGDNVGISAAAVFLVDRPVHEVIAGGGNNAAHFFGDDFIFHVVLDGPGGAHLGAHAALALDELAAELRIDDGLLGDGLRKGNGDGRGVARQFIEGVGRFFGRAFLCACAAARAQAPVHIGGALADFDRKVAHIARNVFHFGIGVERNVGVLGHVHHLGAENTGRAVNGGEGFVQLGHLAADGRIAFHQHHLNAAVGAVKRGLNASHAAADDKHALVDVKALGQQGLVVAQLFHRKLHQFGSLVGVGFHVLADPRNVLADIGHFKHVAVQPRAFHRAAEGGFVHARRAGGNNHAVKLVLVDGSLNGRLPRFGAGVHGVVGIDHVRVGAGNGRHLGAIDSSGDVAAAVADKDAYSHYLPPSAALAFCSVGLAASSRRSSPSLRIRPLGLTHSLFRPSSSSGRSKAMPIIWVK